MAETFLQLRPNVTGARLTIVDGATVTGYRMLLSPEFGNVLFDALYSGERGGLGAALAGGRITNRPIVVPLRIDGGSADAMWRGYQAIAELCDEVNRYGGRLIWRSQGETYRQVLQLTEANVRIREWTKRAQHSGLLEVFLECKAAPFIDGDPYDVRDTFDEDTLATDYTAMSTGTTTLAYAGGTVHGLAPAAAGLARYTRTLEGYAFGDVLALCRFRTGSTVASYRFDLCIAASTNPQTDTALSAYVDGANVGVAKRTAGTPTSLATAAAALAANTTYWLRARRVGARVVAELFTQTAEPSFAAAATATASYTLTNDEHSLFRSGLVALRVTAVATGERYGPLVVLPFTYVGETLPEEFVLQGAIPGDVPARCDVVLAPTGGAAAPPWALVGWHGREAVFNYVWNGDLEDDVNGWAVAAVAGVTGAATSVVRDTTAARTRYGSANALITTPATANTGGTFLIPRRFRVGRTYLMLAWTSSTLATAHRIRLGVSGDIASSGAVALTAAPALQAVAWTPTADRTAGAYACVEVTAAALTGINVDGVVVCEPRITTLASSIASTTAGTMTVASNPPDLPAGPFFALIDSELVLVRSVAGTVWTIARGAEGTTAATHSSAATVYVLMPAEFRGHLEGKGAVPPYGIVEAESCDTGNLFTAAITAGAGTTRGDVYLTKTGIAGPGSIAADFLIDPHLALPDDFTAGELLVEVWARVGMASTLVSPTAILAAAPETATVASGVFTSNYGAVRYAEEWGSTGRPLTKGTAGVLRFPRLGTLRLPVDRARPQRWRLQVTLTYAAGSTGNADLDYLVLVPALQRALSPSGVANTATGYPRFVASTNETIRRVRADLSGATAPAANPAAEQTDHGLGGSVLELPVAGGGNVDAIVKLCSVVPDDPTSDATSEQLAHTGAVHFAVTPRYAIARGS